MRKARPTRVHPTPRSGRSASITSAAAALLTVLAGASRVQAQTRTPDAPAAEALFKEALGLVQAGSWAAGCPKFEQSFALYPSRSTMIHIARCRAHEGKVATAWKNYERALHVEGSGDAERQKGLAELAVRERDALEPRLPRLRVSIAALPAVARVSRDGESVPADTLDRDVPVDPGRHEITADAPGYRKETRSVVLQEGQTIAVQLTLVRAEPVKVEVARPPSGWQLPTGALLAAAGAVGLGAGVATGIASLDLVAGVRTRCGGDHCLSTDTDGRRDVSTAKTLGDVSTASFIAGTALAAAGGALLVMSLTSGARGGTGKSPAPALQASFGPGQITLRGSF